MEKKKYLCVCVCRHAHKDTHAHSQSTSKMARTDLARSLASAARAVVTVGPVLPNRARSALADNVDVLSLSEQKLLCICKIIKEMVTFNKAKLRF